MQNAVTNVQLNQHGQLRHFLSIDGLNKTLLETLLNTAESFIGMDEQPIKKVPLLRGKTIVNLFFENSTRTRTTFELAAKRLSADILNFNISTSATTKGESLFDTLQNLEAMASDMFIIRHPDSGAAHFIAKSVTPNIAIINAGDGRHAHPTQAMLDMLSIRRHKGDFSKLTVAIVGDILHSRVARSQIQALAMLGVPEIRVIGPKTLLPKNIELLPIKIFHQMEAGLSDADVVIMLRLQKERMQLSLIPSEHEYYQCYGLTKQKLAYAKPDAIVMHPGPINRGVEIESSIADSPQSMILKQVNCSVPMRMAILATVMSSYSEKSKPS